MKFRNNLYIAAALVGLTTATAQVSAQELTVKLANVIAPAHDTSMAMDKFAETAAELSDGRIEVQVFHGGQLGSDKDTYEQAILGTIDFASGSSANLVNISKAFEPIHLPFMFEDLDQAYAALDSDEVNGYLNGELEKAKLKWLSFYAFGFRDIDTTDKAVMSPADMKGLKMRTSRSPLEMAGIETFGGAATVVDWPEVYNALKFGIVDGQAQPMGPLVSAKHHEVIKNHTELDWQFYGMIILTSEKQWNSYPEWAQEIFLEAFAVSEDYHRELLAKADADAIQAFKDAGGTVHELSPEARAEFVELGKSIWADSGVSQESIDIIQSVNK